MKSVKSSKISAEGILETLDMNRGFTLLLENEFIFLTSNNIKYIIEKGPYQNRRIIIVNKNKKNSYRDIMVPHNEVRKLFLGFGLEKLFLELKQKQQNLAFIAKDVSLKH